MALQYFQISIKFRPAICDPKSPLGQKTDHLYYYKNEHSKYKCSTSLNCTCFVVHHNARIRGSVCNLLGREVEPVAYHLTFKVKQGGSHKQNLRNIKFYICEGIEEILHADTMETLT